MPGCIKLSQLANKPERVSPTKILLITTVLCTVHESPTRPYRAAAAKQCRATRRRTWSWDLETDQLFYVSSAYSLGALAELAETSWAELTNKTSHSSWRTVVVDHTQTVLHHCIHPIPKENLIKLKCINSAILDGLFCWHFLQLYLVRRHFLPWNIFIGSFKKAMTPCVRIFFTPGLESTVDVNFHAYKDTFKEVRRKCNSVVAIKT